MGRLCYSPGTPNDIVLKLLPGLWRRRVNVCSLSGSQTSAQLGVYTRVSRPLLMRMWVQRSVFKPHTEIDAM